MARTRLGFIGSMAAYLGFAPKSAEAVIEAIADVIIRIRPDIGTIQVMADVSTIQVGPDVRTICVLADVSTIRVRPEIRTVEV